MSNNSQKGFAIVPFLIIIALAAAGVYFYASQKPFPYLVKSPSPTASVDTANWKTYRNEQYGFEVKYPGSWEYEVTIGGDLTLKPKDKLGNYPSFQITPFAIGGTSIDILKSSSEYEGLGEWKSVTIDGHLGITKKIIKNTKVVDGRIVPGEIYYVGYLVEGPKIIYQIRTSQEKDIDFEINKTLLNAQILSTFKFIK